MDSGSFDIHGCNRVGDFFAEKFITLGYETEIRHIGKSGRPLILAKTPGRKAFDCFLCGHIDTVFPKGTASLRPFAYKNGIAFGPGTVDMKAGALLISYLAERFIKDYPEISLSIALNSDEEIGSPDSVNYLREEAAKCRSIFIFEGARKQGQFVNERKGIAKYNIEVKGISSHAGTAPDQGVNAIVELAHTILELDKLKNLSKGTSINVGLVEGGTAVNVVAPTASAIVEIRYRDDDEFIRVTNGIAKLSSNPFLEGAKISFSQISHYPPLVLTEKTKALMELLSPLGLTYVKAGGTSDANRLSCLDIPIIDGCGPGGGFPHSEKEFLDTKTVLERYKLMVEIIKKVSLKSVT